MELEFKHRIQHCGMLRGHLRTSGALATAALATARAAAALAAAARLQHGTEWYRLSRR